MPKVRVNSFAISLDGYGAGPDQGLENPLGRGGESLLFRAKEAAGDRDVRIGGGAATIREYLEARLIDEMHVAIAPVLLGTGESLLEGIDLLKLGYQATEHVPSEGATHVVFTR